MHGTNLHTKGKHAIHYLEQSPDYYIHVYIQYAFGAPFP